MPVVQLFVAGVFAVVFTEIVKTVSGYTESDIGIHNAENGKLMKARNATIVYSLVILASNIMAFTAYEWSIEYSQQFIEHTLVIDAGIALCSILVIWMYLKINHYSRS